MDEGQRKAFETPFGASVVADRPLVGPGSPQVNLPGTGQLCGPCASGGHCPIHAGTGTAGLSIPRNATTSPSAPTATETLGSIVGSFLDQLVGQAAKQIAAELRVEFQEQLREVEERMQAALVLEREQADEEQLGEVHPWPEIKAERVLLELADLLDEEGFANLVGVDEYGYPKMIIVDDPRPNYRRAFITVVEDDTRPLTSFNVAVDGRDPLTLDAGGVTLLFESLKRERLTVVD